MQAESTPSLPPPPPGAHTLLSQYLTLTDGALKRYTVDGYNAQLSIARNYMWLSFITLSGYAALFDRFGLGEMLKDFVLHESGSVFCLLVPMLVLKAAWLSVEVLLNAIQTCTGSSFKETYETIDDHFTELELRGFEANDLYILKRKTLHYLAENLVEALDQSDARAKRLRAMATDIRHSIWWALTGLLLFPFTFL